MECSRFMNPFKFIYEKISFFYGKIEWVITTPINYIYDKKLWREIKNNPRPHHVGIILDGNRRFAKKANLGEVWLGHALGAQKVEAVLAYCYELEIRVVTLYAFSMENFDRQAQEVEKIMEIATQKFKEIMNNPIIHKYRVKVKAIGRINLLPKKVQEVIHQAEEITANYNEFQLNIAIGYGGRSEIVDSLKKIAAKVLEGKIKVDDISEDMIAQHLYTEGLPDPDLIIRTSGEERLSGFLLWQSAYSELCFLEVYWPAIRKIDLWRAIRTYQQRDRRHGK